MINEQLKMNEDMAVSSTVKIICFRHFENANLAQDKKWATTHQGIIIEPRSERRDLLATNVNSELFTEKERPRFCEQLQKI